MASKAARALFDLGCAKTFQEFAISWIGLGFTGFGAGLTVLHDFPRHSLLQTRHIDGIGSNGLLWA